MKRWFNFLSVSLILMVVAACGSPATTTTKTTVSTETAKPITLFVGYVHNVQFAPLYVAIEHGYFKKHGIDLTIETSFDETDGLTRIGVNKLQFGLISGDQVLLARAKAAPVVYVFRWYQRFPVGVVTLDGSGITKPEDLAGRIVGVPGKFGASYVGLQALLNAAKLKESDLKEVSAIGFDTTPIVCGKKVDASVVYIANEPAQIEHTCGKVNIIKIADYANIMSNGLVTNEVTLKDNPDLVRGMTAALAEGLADTIADPKAAYEASRKYVENLAADDAVQLSVLTASIDLWKTDKPGYSDPAAWQLTLDTLRSMGLITENVDLTKVFSNDYLPGK
jgi:NitT/TauT family transport system substrate-binding protein